MTPRGVSDVTVVTVTYNSTGVLPGMLASVPEACEIVIVDNGSADVAALRGLAQAKGALLIENADNQGFGRGCNAGAAAATTEFLLFLNPDARLEPNALEPLLAAAEDHPEVSAFNPRIMDDRGGQILKRKSDLVDRDAYLARGDGAADAEVPVLTGAAIFMAKRVFDRVGGFDPAIFLFYEDDDLSARLRQKAGPLRLVTASHVTHAGGASSSGPALAVERLKAWHMGWSRLYAMRKHRRPWARSRAVAHALMRVLSPGMLTSQLRRTKRLAFLGGTLAALSGRRAEGPRI